jgi:hypothetical protein
MARKTPLSTSKLSRPAKTCPGCFLCMGRRNDRFAARRAPVASSRIGLRLRVT